MCGGGKGVFGGLGGAFVDRINKKPRWKHVSIFCTGERLGGEIVRVKGREEGTTGKGPES